MIKAGFSSFIGNTPLWLMKDTFRKEGFDLTFGDDLRRELLVQGHYQIVGTTLNAILMNLNEMAKVSKVVYAYVEASGEGSDLIVCRGKIGNIDDLANLRIGAQEGSLEHFIFEYLFSAKGVERKHDYYWMPRERYLEEMHKENIDAAVFCNPALSKILQDDRFDLFSGEMKESVLTAIGVFVVQKELLKEQRDKVLQFVSLFLDGVKELNASDNMKLLAKGGQFFSGINNPKDILLQQVDFPTLSENKTLFSKEASDSLFHRSDRWAKFLNETSLYPNLEFKSSNEIFDDSIVTALSNKNVNHGVK